MLNPFNLDMTKMKTMSDSLNAELENTVIEGESGAGMVKAKVTGTTWRSRSRTSTGRKRACPLSGT